jgi:signal peptidase II
MLLSLPAVLGADQIVKRRVLAWLDGGRVVAIGSAVRLGPVRRRTIIAARLGLRPAVIVAAWLACLALVLLALRAGLFATPVSQVALGAALAGAASNLFDVLVRKGVVDYVELGRWPAFNLADAAIVSGVILAFIAR